MKTIFFCSEMALKIPNVWKYFSPYIHIVIYSVSQLEKLITFNILKKFASFQFIFINYGFSFMAVPCSSDYSISSSKS